MGKRSLYYQRERNKGRTVSALLHLFFLAVILIGLPDFLMPRPPEEPAAITVELLPITGVTNVKPQEKIEAPTPKPQPTPEPQKVNPKEAPPVKTAENTPPPPPPKPAETPKPTPKPKEEKPKPTTKPKDEEKEKNKAKPEDLDAVLKAVKEQAQKEKPKEKTSGSQTPAKSNQYNPNLPMSMSEKDAIRSQIAKCWNVPAGAKDAHELVVTLDIEVQQDGTVTKVELASVNKSRYNSDTFFRSAADSAMRAVRMCSPLKGLPPEKYDTWRDMELTFDPKEMLF